MPREVVEETSELAPGALGQQIRHGLGLAHDEECLIDVARVEIGSETADLSRPFRSELLVIREDDKIVAMSVIPFHFPRQSQHQLGMLARLSRQSHLRLDVLYESLERFAGIVDIAKLIVLRVVMEPLYLVEAYRAD